jgi:hypothetical protein
MPRQRGRRAAQAVQQAHPVHVAALAVAGVLAPVQAWALPAPPERVVLQARIDAVREALANNTPAQSCDPSWQVAQAGNWTNWPKWSKWSNWANK